MDIHFNAGGPAASGTECFIANDASAHSQEMAKEICNTASSVMGIKNRGVKTEGQSQHNKIGIGKSVLSLTRMIWQNMTKTEVN